MMLISSNQRSGGHRKAFVPRSPTGSCLVSLTVAGYVIGEERPQNRNGLHSKFNKGPGDL